LDVSQLLFIVSQARDGGLHPYKALDTAAVTGRVTGYIPQLKIAGREAIGYILAEVAGLGVHHLLGYNMVIAYLNCCVKSLVPAALPALDVRGALTLQAQLRSAGVDHLYR